MRPTRLGVKAVGFLLLLFVAFFVSPYSNLFFLQLAFYCVFLVQSAWWCRRNVARLRGRVVTPRPIPADSGDAVLECDVVAERHGARSVSVEIRRERRNTTRLSGIVDLPAGREGRHGFHLPPLPRGLHRARTVRLSSSFPFGLFRSSVALEGELELAVFPRPVDIVGLRSGGLAATVAALSGGVLVPGNDVVGHLRDWREGDSQRAVHWRATARRRTASTRSSSRPPRGTTSCSAATGTTGSTPAPGATSSGATTSPPASRRARPTASGAATGTTSSSPATARTSSGPAAGTTGSRPTGAAGSSTAAGAPTCSTSAATRSTATASAAARRSRTPPSGTSRRAGSALHAVAHVRRAR